MIVDQQRLALIQRYAAKVWKRLEPYKQGWKEKESSIVYHTVKQMLDLLDEETVCLTSEPNPPSSVN